MATEPTTRALRVLLGGGAASVRAGLRLLVEAEERIARAVATLDACDGVEPVVWPPDADPTLEDLAVLVYELLDAHDDTARLAADLAHEPGWRSHLEYLRQLQRIGRTALARAAHGSCT